MDLTFVGGSDRQQGQYRQALHRLLSLPFDSIPLTVSVSFVDGSLLTNGESFDLARTIWTYDSSEATTEVRDDAPGFANADASLEALAASMGLEYNADIHYNETAVHETGHALFAALPESFRIQIAQMFGAKSDDIPELESGDKWEDRIIEGIADTFKEAFLPRRFRVFGNRTNRRIPYTRYPEFRTLFRKGVEAIPSGEGFNHDVLELDESNMRVAWPLSETFLQESSNSFYTIYEAGYDVFEQEIPNSHTFAFSFEPPLLPNTTPIETQGATILFGWRYIIKVNGVVQDKFRGLWGAGRPSNPEEVEFWAEFWLPASQTFDAVGDRVPSNFSTWMGLSELFFVPNEWEESSPPFTSNYRVWEDARGMGPLPVLLSSSVKVSPGDVVSIHARAIGAEWAIPGGPNFEEEAIERMGRLRPPWSDALPLMHYAEPGTEGGAPIDVPTPSLEGQGLARGARATRRPTAGFVH